MLIPFRLADMQLHYELCCTKSMCTYQCVYMCINMKQLKAFCSLCYVLYNTLVYSINNNCGHDSHTYAPWLNLWVIFLIPPFTAPFFIPSILHLSLYPSFQLFFDPPLPRSILLILYPSSFMKRFSSFSLISPSPLSLRILCPFHCFVIACPVFPSTKICSCALLFCSIFDLFLGTFSPFDLYF